IFLVPFFAKRVKGNAVFWAAVVTQVCIITIYRMDIVSFLWLNVIGALLLWVLAWVLQIFANWQIRQSASNLR
ncbi:MAG TPA: hypothetical protein VLL95_07800, partial [Phnomibacter sp.]|nr:hypothetical protein [Phnomibacter sp.]